MTAGRWDTLSFIAGLIAGMLLWVTHIEPEPTSEPKVHHEPFYSFITGVDATFVEDYNLTLDDCMTLVHNHPSPRVGCYLQPEGEI